MSKSNEAFWWSLFSAGGVMAALFIPGFILATGLLLPLFYDRSDPDAATAFYNQVYAIVSHPVIRIAVLGIVFLSFFHCAHRIKHTLMDMGLRNAGGPLALVCYGGALGGTITAAVIILSL